VAKQKKARLDPDDVLEGRSRPNARELLALIHEVNPSGHDHLSPRETARRYAQKSRLQSLLIRRFPDEIRVEPGDDEPGVIGLRHRGSGADACHAVLASLDDDARSWAQRELDLGDEEAESARALTPRALSEPAGPPSGAPLDDFSTDELLRRGKTALKEYDYPAARERFEAAFDRGNAEAALLLFTVLVEHLGLDEDALALEERLDAGARKQSEIRLLLALAAARSYQRDRALRLAPGDVGDAAAEVFVALARGALERGELDHAAADAGEAQRRGPSHPALLDLAETIKRRRAEERAPLEAEAQRLFAEGRFDEAEARAAAIAARWSESVVAQTIHRAGQERRRRDEARALAHEGSVAAEAGEALRALGLLRRALTLGLEGEDAARAQRHLAWAEAAERAQAETDKAIAVLHLLRDGHVLRALTDYVALDQPRRDRVKGAHPLDELIFLDQTGIHGSGPEAKAAAQAVMALRRAITSATADAATAVELLLAHWPVLHVLPDAVKCLEVSQDLERLRRMTAAIEAQSAGMTAFDGSPESLSRSLKLLTAVRREDLSEEDRVDHDRIVARMRRMGERMDRAKLVGKLRNSGDLAGARDVLDGLIRFEEAGKGIDDEDGVPVTDWHGKRADVVRDLAKIADVRISGAPALDCLLGAEAPALRDVPQSLLPGGQELVLAEAHGGLVFYQILDTLTGRVTRRTSMRMRRPFEVGRVAQRAGHVVLLGSDGMCLDVNPLDWEIGAGISISAGSEHAEQSVLAPGGRFAWGSLTIDGWWTGVSVQDLDRHSEGRGKTFSESVLRVSVRPLLGLDEPRVVMSRDRGTLTVYEARGALFGTTQHDLPVLPRSVTVHPSGKGLFALIREGGAEAPRARWAELAADGMPQRAPAGEDRIVDGLDPDAFCETAVALGAGVVFVLAAARGARRSRTPRARRLIGFAAGGAGLTRCFDVEVPARVTLAQDVTARTVVALSPHEEGIEVVPLGATPPTFRTAPPATSPLALADLTLVPLEPCAPAGTVLWSVTGDAGSAGLGIEYLQHLGSDDRRAMIERTIGPEDRPHVVARHLALWRVPKPAFFEEFAAIALARHPGDPEMLQIPAQRAALAGDWVAVRDGLAPFDPAALGDAPAQHHDHLLGAALLMTGDVEEARRVLTRGAARAGGCCDLSVPLALVGAPGGATPSPAYAAARALDDAVQAADACLAAGDRGGARRALAGLAVREAREVQTLARLARAWLDEPTAAAPAGASVDGFALRLALAAFLAAHAEKAPTARRELPFAGARWDAATLDALATRAQARLDADKGG
jgi:hypothetical protein